MLEGDAEIDLVAIDTFRFMTGVLENASLNAAEKDFLLMRPFKELADASGVAILATFHEKKRDGDPFKRDMLEAMSSSTRCWPPRRATPSWCDGRRRRSPSSGAAAGTSPTAIRSCWSATPTPNASNP